MASLTMNDTHSTVKHRGLSREASGHGLGPSILDQVLALNDQGFRTIPLHAARGGRCTCGVRSCASPGKHPRIVNWTSAASKDHARARSWWGEFPDANVGVVAGDGIVVIDLDSEKAESWVSDQGVPSTATVTTGRGKHLYFQGDVRSFDPFPGVEVRAAGRLVVAPPSIHHTGVPYEWSEAPWDVPLASLPSWVIDAASTRHSRPKRRSAKRRLRHDQVEVYPEGQRNDQLYARACQMRRAAGLSETEIRAALQVTNRERCDPPLDETEVAQIARSAALLPIQRAGAEALLQLGLAPRCALVYLVLVSQRLANGTCCISYPHIVELSGLSKSSSQRSIADLVTCRVINKKTRPYKSNIYIFNDVSEWTPQQGEEND